MCASCCTNVTNYPPFKQRQQPTIIRITTCRGNPTKPHHNLGANAATRGGMIMHLELVGLGLPSQILLFCIAFINEATRGPGKATFSIILMFSTLSGCLLTPFCCKCSQYHVRGWPGLELEAGCLLPHLGLGFQSNPEIHKVVGFLCAAEYYHVGAHTPC